MIVNVNCSSLHIDLKHGISKSKFRIPALVSTEFYIWSNKSIAGLDPSNYRHVQRGAPNEETAVGEKLVLSDEERFRSCER
jgi:hypothetical protein